MASDKEDIERIKIEVDTGDAIKELEKVQDKMEESLGGESAANIAKKNSKEITDSFNSAAESIGKSFEKSSKKSSDSLEKISKSAEKIGDNFEKIDIDKTLSKDSKEASDEIEKNIGNAVDEVNKKIDDLSKAFNNVDVSGFKASLDGLKSQIGNLATELNSTMNSIKTSMSSGLVGLGLNAVAGMANAATAMIAGSITKVNTIKPTGVDRKDLEYSLKDMNIPEQVEDISEKTKLNIKPELDEKDLGKVKNTIKDIDKKDVNVNVKADPNEVEHVKQVVEDIPRKVRIDLASNVLDLGLNEDTDIIKDQEKRIVRVSDEIKNLNDRVKSLASTSKAAAAHTTPILDKLDIEDVDIYSKEMDKLSNIADLVSQGVGNSFTKVFNSFQSGYDTIFEGNVDSLNKAVDEINLAVKEYASTVIPAINELSKMASENYYVGLKDDSAFKSLADNLKTTLKSMDISLDNTIEKFNDFMNNAEDAEKSIDFRKSFDKFNTINKNISVTTNSISKLIIKMKELGADFKELGKIEADLENFDKKFSAIPLIGKPIVDIFNAINSKEKDEIYKELNDKFNERILDIKSISKNIDIELAIGKVKSDFTGMEYAFNEVEELLKEYKNDIEKAINGIEDAISDSESLKNAFENNLIPKDALEKIKSLNLGEEIKKEIDQLAVNSSSLQNSYDTILEKADEAMSALQETIKDVDLERIQVNVANMKITDRDELVNEFKYELERELSNVGIEINEASISNMADLMATANEIKSINFDTSGMNDISNSVEYLNKNIEELNAEPLVELLKYIEKQTKNLNLDGIADGIKANGETFKTVFKSLDFDNLDFNKLSVLASRFTQLGNASESTKQKLGDIYKALEQFEKDEKLGLISDDNVQGMRMFVDKIIGELKKCSDDIELISSEAGKKLRENLFSIDRDFITSDSIGAIIKSLQDDINMYVDNISIDNEKVKELLSIPMGEEPVEIPVELGELHPTLSEVLRAELPNVKQVLSNLTGIAGDIGNQMSQSLRNALSSSDLPNRLGGLFSNVKSSVSNASNNIKTKLSDAANSVRNSFNNTNIGRTIGNQLNSARPYINNFRTKMVEAINSVKNTLANSKFAQAFAPLKNTANNIALGMRNSFKNAVNKIRNTDTQKLEEALQSVKEASDRVRQAFYKMADGLKGVFQKLKDCVKSTKDMGTAAKTTNGVFQQMMSTLAPFLSIFALINGLKSSITLGLDATETESMYETVFSTSGALQEMNSWIKEVNSTLGVNASTLQKNTATIYNFATNMGVASSEAVNMSKDITKLAQDMASFYNMDAADVFENLKAALSGSAETVTKYGMNLFETNVKQYAYANGIAAVGSELTQNQKVMARYMLMLEQAGAANGDLARTIKSPANQLRLLKEEFVQFGTTIGQAMQPILVVVIPALRQLVQWLLMGANALKEFMWSFASLMGIDMDFSMSGGIADDTTGNAMAEQFQNASESVSDTSDAVDGTTDSVKKLQRQLGSMDEINVLSSNKDDSDNGGTVDTPAVETPDLGIVDGIEEQTKQSESIMDKFANKLSVILKDIASAFKEGFMRYLPDLQTAFDQFKEKFGNMCNSLGGFLKSVYNNGGREFIEHMGEITAAVGIAALEIGGVILDSLAQLWEHLDPDSNPVTAKFILVWNNVAIAVKQALLDIGDAFRDLMENGGNELLNSFVDMSINIGNTLGMLVKTVIEATRKIWEHINPKNNEATREFLTAFQNMFDKVSEVMSGIQEYLAGFTESEGMNYLLTFFDKLIAIGTAVCNTVGILIDAFVELWKYMDPSTNPYTQALIDAFFNLMDTFGQLDTIIQNFLDNGGQRFLENMADIAAIIGTAVIDAINWLVQHLDDLAPILETVSGIAKNIAEFIADHPKLVLGVAAAIFTLSTAISGFISLGTGIKGIFTAIEGFQALMPVLSAVGSAISGLAGPILAVIAVIVLISATIYSLWKNSEDFRDGWTKVWENIKGTLKNVWDNVIKPVFDTLCDALKEIWEDSLKPLWEKWCYVWEQISGIVTDLLNNVVFPILNKLIEWFGPVISTALQNSIGIIKSAIKLICGIFETLLEGVGDVIGGIRRWLDGIIEFITGVFTGDWQMAWEGIKDIFGGIWDSLAGLVKVPINLIIDALNFLIDAMNSLSFEIPDWVPGGLGGREFGFDIPRIPKLAQGGIIDKPTIAQVGEAGPEAIVPLKNTAFVDTIGLAVAKAVSNELKGINNTNNSGNNQPIEITVKVGNTTLGKAAINSINEVQRKAGRTLLEI